MAASVHDLIETIQQLPPPDQQFVAQSVLVSLQRDSAVQTIDALKARNPDEWLAIEIPQGEDRYDPSRGRLIAHNRDRRAVWEKVETLPSSTDIFVFFNGEVLARDFAIAIDDTNAS